MKRTAQLILGLSLLLNTAAISMAEEAHPPAAGATTEAAPKEAGGEHGGGHGAGANPFVGQIYQAIAAAIVFFVVLAVLKKKAWGPIVTGLQAREDKIHAEMEAAEKASTEAAQTLKAYQEQLSQAQAEARKIVDQARADATKVGAQLKAEAETEIKGMKDRAIRDMKAAKEQFTTELYAEAATLATTVASRILKREINPGDQEQLVQESLAELSKLNRN